MPRRRRRCSREINPTLFSCRYCLEDDTPENLVAPCICGGSIKYVHNDCLLRWYTVNPTTGLQCSVCKTECAYELTTPIEIGLSPEFRVRYRLESPFLLTLFYHWAYVFVCLYGFGMTSFAEMRDSYILFQFSITGVYCGLFFSTLVWQVKRKRVYVQKWLFSDYSLLILFHIYCIYLLPTYSWISGIGSTLCCFHYFYVHEAIVEEMNRKSSLRFITRRPSSSQFS